MGCNVYKTIISELDNINTKTFESLSWIVKTSQNILKYTYNLSYDESNKNIVNSCFALGVKLEKNNETEVQTLSGKIFVFTGSLEIFTRKQAKDMVERLGGRANNSVSKNTNYVVAGAGSGAKLDKAKQLGIDIINEHEFEKLVK